MASRGGPHVRARHRSWPRVGTIVAICALLIACRRVPHDATVIGFEGVGLIRIGLAPDEVERRVGEKLVLEGIAAPTDSCYMAHFASKPTLQIMVEGGRLVRVETGDARYKTSQGVRMGDSPSIALEKYGELAHLEPDKYDPNGHDVVIRSKDGKWGMVMYISEERVIAIQAGAEPAAEYVEHCL